MQYAALLTMFLSQTLTTDKPVIQMLRRRMSLMMVMFAWVAGDGAVVGDQSVVGAWGAGACKTGGVIIIFSNLMVPPPVML